MKLSQVKENLRHAESVNFRLENGQYVPGHFHITEVGVVAKHFIDCGGTVRDEKVANFQLWDANDHDHRLKPQKLINIIALSERVLGMDDLEVEVEYQSDTIGKYGLDFDGKDFILLSKRTACLATESCGGENGRNIAKQKACCPTESACC
jgi:hypothetical protein